MGELGTTYGGLTGKSKEDFGHGDARFVPYTNVFDNPIADPTRLGEVEIDMSQNRVLHGDALFTVSSETPEEVGMSSVWLSDLDNLYLNSFCFGYRQDGSFDSYYLAYMLRSKSVREDIELLAQGISRFNISKGKVMEVEVPVPDMEEQRRVGTLFYQLDNLITLHQRDHRTARADSPSALILVSFSLREPPNHEEGEESSMLSQLTKDDLLCTYYREWIAVYKEGAVRQVTLNKYSLALAWVERLAPELTLGQLDRIAYQGLLNQYAKTHERQTTMDFHHQLKGAILDAVDEGLVPRDPTRKAIVKGKPPRPKKSRYLNQFELHKLLASLELGQDIGWEWFILLVAKTGLRFSEALAVTPADFDFSRQTLSVSKTWDYKNGGGFVPTKNRSSIRKVQIDWQLIVQFSVLIKGLPEDKPMFVKDDRKVYNSTANDVLARLCRKAEVPVISIHGLRHTHASLLLFAGVSIASVAKRLGHASMNTTEKTYLHIIQELENKDVDLVMRSLTSLV